MSVAPKVHDPAIGSLAGVLVDTTRTIHGDAILAAQHSTSGNTDAAVGTVMGIEPALRDALAICETIQLLQRLRRAHS